jgi:hypothetical protein
VRLLAADLVDRLERLDGESDIIAVSELQDEVLVVGRLAARQYYPDETSTRRLDLDV